MKVSLDNVSELRGTPKPHAGGSLFHGFVNATLVITSEAGKQIRVFLSGIKLRTTVGGKDRIDFPEDVRPSTTPGEADKRFPIYRPDNRETREVLTSLVFAAPHIAPKIAEQRAGRNEVVAGPRNELEAALTDAMDACGGDYVAALRLLASAAETQRGGEQSDQDDASADGSTQIPF